MASDGEVSCTNDPNFAVIYSFLKVFGDLYTLEIPTIQKLQEFIENTQEVLEPLRDLHVRLLRRALKSAQSHRWEKCVIKFCHHQGFHQEAWEIERFSYKKASTQVKLKILKVLLEYQFSCHSKFKNAVNAIPSQDLRLDPIGSDKSGRVYWLQIDSEANLLLYREDQDEETWELIARDREGLVNILSYLKTGEDCNIKNDSINEDSSSADNVLETKASKSNEDSNEEFLSPESESEHESDSQAPEKVSNEIACNNISNDNDKPNAEAHPDCEEKNLETNISTEVSTEEKDEKVEVKKDAKVDVKKDEKVDVKNDEQVLIGETIEEPVMMVTGEGSGVECESGCFIIGEEITESVMYFWGEGNGYDNDTGNPDNVDRSISPAGNTCVEGSTNNSNNDQDNHANGECVNNDEESISNESMKKGKKNTKTKFTTGSTSVAKRLLKTQSDDFVDTLGNESDSKKHCIRDIEENDPLLEDSNQSKSETLHEDEINEKYSNKKSFRRGKKSAHMIKKCDKTNTKIKLKDSSLLDETKTNLLEKRKNSLSSSDHEEGNNLLDISNKVSENHDDALKTHDTLLPPKKLKLENSADEESVEDNKGTGKKKTRKSLKTSEESADVISNCDKLENSNDKSGNMCNEDDADSKVNISEAGDDAIIKRRKKILINREALKTRKSMRKSATPNKEISKSNDECNADNSKKSVKQKGSTKSLKRSLLETSKRDKSKSETLSEEENNEPETGGKRLKMKPKKMKSSRKKPEEKTRKESTSESENETLLAIGKRNGKKLLKKKVKTKKDKSKKSEGEVKPILEDDGTPVRQSRRIAQLKIKEEAERRHEEEVALRKLKLIHKKKIRDEEEDWHASGPGSSSGEAKACRQRAGSWHSESTQPPSDSDTDEPIFEHEHEEPDLDFAKSDHEFSPESDLEHGEPVEPLRLARTLDEGADEGFCAHCGKGDHPEWILLCDNCDTGYHASCLKPVLFLVPEGDWFCPPCQHEKLIKALENELVKYDELVKVVDVEKKKREQEEAVRRKERGESKEVEEKQDEEKAASSEDSSDWTSSSEEEEAVYRLRERRQLPVSYHAREYDRLMSSAIKEEYVEPTSTAGNQGRGKDISTIIEAAEEEKMKAEQEAIEQGQPVERKVKRKQRKKARKLNSLEVPSEDDDETDEDFKDIGVESSSEDISSDGDKESGSGSNSSDSLPIRRSCRPEKKDRARIVDSPELKKKKGVFSDTSSESSDTKDWAKKKKNKVKHKKRHDRSGPKRMKKRRGLTQYDSEGNVIRARVTYGGLSGPDDENDWSPKHRTRQKKINYTEMPNTESEDEMHKSSGKHMPDSSDEYKINDSDATSDSDLERKKRRKSVESEGDKEEKRQEAYKELMNKTAIVPLDRLSEAITKEKMEALERLTIEKQKTEEESAATVTPQRGRGSRGRGGSRGNRGSRRGGQMRPSASTAPIDDALSKLVGVKIKDLSHNPAAMITPSASEREKKRLEKEARLAEKEAKKLERIQKKEEKEKLKEQRAKEREEKRLARLAVQETKRQKKESFSLPISGFPSPGPRPMRPEMHRMPNMYQRMPMRHPSEQFQQEHRFPAAPRLQVRPELRAMQPDLANVRAPRLAYQPPHAPHAPHAPRREGTLSVAGSPQPFKPVSEEPSIITRMPHMMPQQFRNPMMYPPGSSPYGHPRGPSVYPMHQPHSMNHPPNMGNPAQRHQYPVPGQGYYPQHLRGPHPGYPPSSGPPPPQRLPLHPPPLLPNANPSGSPTPPASRSAPTPPGNETITKIKSEIKTEPEFSGDGNASPSTTYPASPPKDGTPRIHPKIKHTENKDRRPRFPLGPYAPQYGPYGPYAPPAPPAPPPHYAARLPYHQHYLPRAPPPMHLMKQLMQPSGPFPRRPPAPPPAPLDGHRRPSGSDKADDSGRRDDAPERNSPPSPSGSDTAKAGPPERENSERSDRPTPDSPRPVASETSGSQISTTLLLPRPPMGPTPYDPQNAPLSQHLPPSVISEQIPALVPQQVPHQLPSAFIKREIEELSDDHQTESENCGQYESNGEPPKVDQINRHFVENPQREEGSVFGGLVSYFSSQREEDIDN